jgi:hypothetical protein
LKRGSLHIVLFLLSVSVCFAQRSKKDTLKLPFQDSVRIVLENTRNTDAMAIGAAFSNIWAGLGPDLQIKVLKQSKMMKKKGFKLRPHFQNYFGALVDAINVENADDARLTSYLQVAGQVIEFESINKASNFFSNSREFFQHHALHFEKSYRLYARDDDYQFEYKKVEVPPPPAESDTTQSPFDTWSEKEEETKWEDQPVDTVPQATPPMWAQPIYVPELMGAVITFNRVSLNFSTPYDSAFLNNTKGTFSLEDNLFVGEGGRFDWSSAGLGPDSVYYDLKQFVFNAAKPVIKAEQGKLTYVGRVNGSVDGVFEFQSVKHKDDASATYPRFMSYESSIAMLGLSDDKMRYTGGFALNGQRVYSSSVTGGNARLEVLGETDKKFEAQSRLFEFQDSTIVSKNAAVRIYQGNDSIFHPAISFRYEYGKKFLTLHRSKGTLKDTPFTSSFFKVDFTGDVLRWSMKTDSTGADSLNIFTTAGLSQEPMVIESQDFFDPNDFKLLKGVGFSFHPLVVVAQYASDNGVSEFFADDLANYSGKKFNEINGAMSFLAQKGMIEYSTETGKIHIKDKALHMNEARKNKSDYDNMKIHSIIDGPANATINFPKGYMTVRGVEEFKVSDSLNVQIKPDSSVITILQNRDIKFNGKITAGNFEINGKDFMLKYDSFFINLNHIDSIRFYVTELNAKGQQVRRRVNNAMVGADSTAAAAGGLDTGGSKKTQGTLFINRPNNKSGREKIPNYPRLDASAGGVIYFDRKEVLDGAYDRSVFFVVPPFKLDSLSDADPGAINFEGTFVTSGMFPSFKEKLHTMADKSLGFQHGVPAAGYPLYNTEGKLFGAMSLDNAGVRATGRVDYLAATVESKDFIFYPDSVVGKGDVGELKESQFGAVWYPQVKLPEYKLKWLPKQDKFALKNLRDPFSLYNGTAQLEGDLIVTKKGTEGDGKLITRGSESKSNEFSFSAKDFGARHANFQVKTTNPDKPALSGDDVRLKFNLEQNYADISPEVVGTAAIEFPYAQFKTSITDARWDLNTQKITMTKDKEAAIEDSYFYTTRKELDSLVFNAEKAEYDIRTQQLKVSGIPFIVVADAKITPEGGEVLILENAKIGQLKNTTIVVDTLNGYHRLTEGVVDIVSRKEFSGYATYQYVNALKDTFAIKMTDFHLEAIADATQGRSRRQPRESIATQQTVANGVVEDKESLVIAPRIFYKGNMTMYATKPALQLKGFVKLDLKKIKNYNTWIRHEQSGDETEIFLDFDKALTEEGSKVEAGLHFADDNSLYITFIFDKKNPDDEDFFLPSGSLFFDNASTEFKIEDRQKAAGEKLSGKVFAYNEDKQEVRFEGPITFFKGSKDFTLTASALGSGSLETNDIKMNSFVMADMNLPSGVYDLMATKLMEIIANEGAAEGLGDQTELLYKIADIIGERAVKDYEAKSLQNYVSLGTIPALAKPLVFANVNLKWAQKDKAFYSEGSLGVSNIGRKDINGAFEGFMEARKNEDGTPVFHVFFKASPEAWYYFGYEDNRMLVHSADPTFNELIAKKTNASKAKVGELVFVPGSDEEVMAFITRFRKNYYGIDAPYDLGGTSAASKKKDEKKKDAEDDGF